MQNQDRPCKPYPLSLRKAYSYGIVEHYQQPCALRLLRRAGRLRILKCSAIDYAMIARAPMMAWNATKQMIEGVIGMMCSRRR